MGVLSFAEILFCSVLSEKFSTMIPILDNSERARRAILFFWALLGTYVLLIFSGISVLAIGIQNVEESQQSILITMSFVLAYILIAGVYLAVIIVYIQWFRRAYHNLKKAGHQLEMSEGWAAGAWFVPFANLVLPYRIMKEIWYKTQVEFTKEPKNHTIVQAWWLVFMGGNVVERVLSKIADDDDISQGAFFAVISSGLHIIGILLAVQIVKQVADFEASFKQRLRIDTVGQRDIATEEEDKEEEHY